MSSSVQKGEQMIKTRTAELVTNLESIRGRLEQAEASLRSAPIEDPVAAQYVGALRQLLEKVVTGSEITAQDVEQLQSITLRS